MTENEKLLTKAANDLMALFESLAKSLDGVLEIIEIQEARIRILEAKIGDHEKDNSRDV